MMTLVVYDVNTEDPAGKKRLRLIANQCRDYGQRVQNSVFEVNADYATWIMVKQALLKIMNAEKDSLRFYYLGNKWQSKIESHGKDRSVDSEGFLTI